MAESTLRRGNAYGAHSWAEAAIYPFTQPEQPHVMTLTVLHWIPEDSMCAITLPLIAPTRACRVGTGCPPYGTTGRISH